MKRIFDAPARWRERGVAAVEAAIVLPILVAIIAVPTVQIALYLHQYEGAQKAVHDAALYVATAPTIELTTAGPDGSFAAVGIAKSIITRELASLTPPVVQAEIDFVCEFKQGAGIASQHCNTQNLTNGLALLRIDVSIYIPPTMIPGMGYVYNDSYATVRYVGD